MLKVILWNEMFLAAQDLQYFLYFSSFLVAADGVVFEGRGWGVVGAHTKGSNQDSLGIAFMGNFNSK